ncbi:MAG: FAD-dependent thymidylate synthase [Planctomycetes bacterium]|nr:FAD-dependent thymidylate synthase [Planctomycetota bacterium]
MKVELLTITPDAERLIETAGRTAYLSQEKQGRDTEKVFIKMLVKKGHLSVLEHAVATFRLSGVSRAFTHQLVRHRLCSFTQQSQRYVDESKFYHVEPPSIAADPECHALFAEFMEHSRQAYTALQKKGIKKEDARFVLPNAVTTQLIVTANLREWKHIIQQRGHRHAQWEIRYAIIEILRILKKHLPTVFVDFEIDDEKKIIVKKKEE